MPPCSWIAFNENSTFRESNLHPNGDVGTLCGLAKVIGGHAMRYCASFERVCNVLKAALALVFLFGCVIANRAEAQNNMINPTNGRVLVNPIRAFVIYWLPPGVALDTTVVGNIGNFESLTQKFFSDISGTNYFNIVTQYPGTCGTCVVQNFASNPVTLGGHLLIR